MKKHNFSAGPAILPASVMQEAAQGCIDLNGSGLSVLEISHRSKDFEAILNEGISLTRELLGVSDEYDVLFLSGGASTQFALVPMNLLNQNEIASYVDTGTWADKAIKEARQFGHVHIAAASKEANYNYIPKTLQVPSNAKYLHITSNNTIFGTQWQNFPELKIPMVVDMSSDIFSRPIPMDRFGLIYAGAQKNMGPAGTTLVIVRKDLLGTVSRKLPSMFDYKLQAENNSLYNTPPAFPIYVSMLTLRWVKAQGGLEAMAKINQDKAQLLYNEIDSNPCFYGSANVEDRSLMNVCFLAKTPEMEAEFLKLCKDNACDGIKGHRSVGGFRASIYNAMPKSSVQVLVDLMKEVAKKFA